MSQQIISVEKNIFTIRIEFANEKIISISLAVEGAAVAEGQEDAPFLSH